MGDGVFVGHGHPTAEDIGVSRHHLLFFLSQHHKPSMPVQQKTTEPGPEMESTAKTVGDVVRWDECHSNPRAEVVLVSEDMVGFRVDAWYLKMKR